MAQLDTAKVVVDEITLVGSRCCNFVTALDLLRGGHVQVAPMISATFALGDAMKAFEYVHQPSCLKVLLASAA
jgi:threonine dehydrogenase-like Zn-dependent dehydrogenase